MAIKVNGTTVIDDSRNFTNIAGGFKTVNGTSVVGSGDISAGASTSAGAVGTYTWGRPKNVTNYATGATASSMYSIRSDFGSPAYWNNGGNYWVNGQGETAESGTWRSMGGSYGRDDGGGDGFGNSSLWVRIS